MNVFITSFQRSFDMVGKVPVFSVAMYQPKGMDYPRIDWALIGMPDGSDWIRPRNFIGEPEPLVSYREALSGRYEGRVFDAKFWMDMASQAFGDAICLCCWCPYDQAAKRQMTEHGSYVCHTDVLASFIENRLGHRVWLDHDRRHMKPLS